MISSNLGLAIAIDVEGRLEGILSDGDIKRILELHSEDFFSRTMDSVMIKRPITVQPEVLAEVALRRMETETRSGITGTPVVDEAGRVVGIIHMHDILKEKIR
jgi:arabinose-5-phosphate isomerase